MKINMKNQTNFSDVLNTNKINCKKTKQVTFPNGFFIYIGTSSCRVYEIIGQSRLEEKKKIRYNCVDWTQNKEKYLNGIISDIKTNVSAYIKKLNRKCIIKTFADVEFLDLFGNNSREREIFSIKFYKETGLCFNIISLSQTRQNMIRLFNNWSFTNEDVTAIINIGTQYIDLYVISEGDLEHFDINDISINGIKSIINEMEIKELWDDSDIDIIKDSIKKEISSKIKEIVTKYNKHITKAIILKGEKSFMEKNGYCLKMKDGHVCISMQEYKAANKKQLFKKDYYNFLKSKYKQNNLMISSEYGFKYGHILLETIMEELGILNIYPFDEICIHGNPETAYIFNVVLSGSTHGNREEYFLEIKELLLGYSNIKITSPIFLEDKLIEITDETQIEHICAIRECDLLLVCNKDGYIGQHTSAEIYGAYLLNKFIAFCNEPNDEFEYKNYIPHEIWRIK